MMRMFRVLTGHETTMNFYIEKEIEELLQKYPDPRDPAGVYNFRELPDSLESHPSHPRFPDLLVTLVSSLVSQTVKKNPAV